MLDWSLVGGPIPAVVLVAGAVAATLLLLPRGPAGHWWATAVTSAVLGGIAVTAAIAVLTGITLGWLPWAVLGCIAGPAVAVGLGVARSRAGARRGGAIVAVVAVGLTAAMGVNVYYDRYPTVRAAIGLGDPDASDFAPAAAPPPAQPADSAPVPEHVAQLSAAPPGQALSTTWTPPADMPANGKVSQVDIPGTVSGFTARPGWVYLPPAYLGSTRAQLPVLIMLPGQPGGPGDWLDGGRLAERMDAYAAAHDGLAPVVVMPDDLGSDEGNPLCLDSQLGNAATYLTVDVPGWIRHNLQIDEDPQHWAIGGLSHGGTCSLQMALNAPQLFPTFLDISGQSEPALDSRAQTVEAAFGDGPDAASRFQAVNPLDLLQTHHYLQTAAMLFAGSDDTEFGPQAQTVYAALQAAKIPSTLTVLPGGHEWAVWGPAFDQALPWLGGRLGLTD